MLDMGQSDNLQSKNQGAPKVLGRLIIGFVETNLQAFAPNCCHILLIMLSFKSNSGTL